MPLQDGAVVSLCDFTGNMVRPWAEAGFDCLCIDILHSIRRDRVEQVGAGSITYRWADVRSVTLDELGKPRIMFSFPPCTDLAVSGARDFEKKGLRRLIDALELVEACRTLCQNSGAPWFVENPVSRLAGLWRAPDYRFDPCDYGDPYNKKTCLWTGGGFIMPPKNRVEPTEGSKMLNLPDSKDRLSIRNATPMGFARATFAANYTEGGKP